MEPFISVLGPTIIGNLKSIIQLPDNHACSKIDSYNRRALDALVKVIPPVSFAQPAAQAYAKIRAAAPDRTKDALDKLIASHAKSLDLTLVTNLSDFQVYSGVAIENWIEEA